MEAMANPAWLRCLLSQKFFMACIEHAELRKNERNIYCIACSRGICQHCLPSHNFHHLLQIRRYVYQDVIRLQDLQKLLDCSGVQTYMINSARVVFLNERPQPRPPKGCTNTCHSCDRSLQDAYNYCSIACKVEVFAKQGRDMVGRRSSRGVSSFEMSVVVDLDNDGLLLSANSENDGLILSPNSENDGIILSPNSENDGLLLLSPNSVCNGVPSPTTSSGSSSSEINHHFSPLLPHNRRKGNPTRSPFW